MLEEVESDLRETKVNSVLVAVYEVEIVEADIKQDLDIALINSGCYNKLPEWVAEAINIYDSLF